MAALSRRWSSGFASGLKHPLDAGSHLIVRNKLSAIGLFDTLAHGSAIARIPFQQPQGDVLHEMLGIGASLVRILRQARFLFGSEVHFHGSSLAERKTASIKERTNAAQLR